jgi:hypothetical protein
MSAAARWVQSDDDNFNLTCWLNPSRIIRASLVADTASTGKFVAVTAAAPVANKPNYLEGTSLGQPWAHFGRMNGATALAVHTTAFAGTTPLWIAAELISYHEEPDHLRWLGSLAAPLIATTWPLAGLNVVGASLNDAPLAVACLTLSSSSPDAFTLAAEALAVDVVLPAPYGSAKPQAGYCQLAILDAVQHNPPVEASQEPGAYDCAVWEVQALILVPEAPNPINSGNFRNPGTSPRAILQPIGCFCTLPGGWYLVGRAFTDASADALTPGIDAVLANSSLGSTPLESCVVAIPRGAVALVIRSWNNNAGAYADPVSADVTLQLTVW